MKTQLLKYKHYLLIILALLVINHVVLPLAEWQNEQGQYKNLLEKKQLKTAELLNDQTENEEVNQQLIEYLTHADKYLYNQKSEAEFKLSAQTQIESILNSADCQIQVIGFQGNQQILPRVQKWHMEIRYKGDANCLMKTTRGIESASPNINIEGYSYGVRSFDKNVKVDFNALLKVSVWYKTAANAEGQL